MNSAGTTGAYSEAMSAETMSVSGGGDSAPGAPTSFVATAVSVSQINLAWQAPTGAISGYRIQFSTNGNTFAHLYTTDATTLAYKHSGLADATTYYYQVAALSLAGLVGVYTDVVPSTTTTISGGNTGGAASVPDEEPTGLTAQAVSFDQINLSWTAPIGSSPVLSYSIELSATGNSGWATILTDITETSYSSYGSEPWEDQILQSIRCQCCR